MQGVCNLDDPAQDGLLIVVAYRGVKMAVSKDRLLELLRREEDYLKFATSHGSAGGNPSVPSASETPPTRGRQLELTAVTHASLSSRIKKVYTYSTSSRALRPAHLGLLKELIDNFDWVLPQYPNTRLEQHLSEIRTWSGVPDDFKDELDRFLKRYTSARKVS